METADVRIIAELLGPNQERASESARFDVSSLRPSDSSLARRSPMSSTTPFWDQLLDLLFQDAPASGPRPENAFLEHLGSSAVSPRLQDLSGDVVDLRDLPEWSEEIILKQALAIIQRFGGRVSATPSSGEIAACFENHLLYAVGNSEQLTDVQRRLIMSLCAIANRVPFSLMRQSQFALDSLDKPSDIRDALVASHYAKSNYLRRIDEAVKSGISRFEPSPPRRILLIGFANGAVQAVKSLGEAAGVKVSVTAVTFSIPGRVGMPGPAYNLISSQPSDEDPGVLWHEALSADEVREQLQRSEESEFDAVLTVSKAVRKRDKGQLGIINSAPYVNLVNDLRSVWKIPLIVVTGLFKFWPSALNSVCDDYLGEPGESEANSLDAEHPHSSINYLITERGVFSADEFLETPFSSLIFGSDSFLTSSRVAAAYVLKDQGIDDTLRKLVDSGSHNGKCGPNLQTTMTSSEVAPEATPATGAKENLQERRRRDARREMSQYQLSGDFPQQYWAADAYFKEMAKDPDWLKARLGKFVSLLGEDPVCELTGDSAEELRDQVYREWGYRPIYIRKVDRGCIKEAMKARPAS